MSKRAFYKTLRFSVLGIPTLVMPTGDNARMAQTVVQTAGVTEFRADLLPENKITVLKELMDKHSAVAIVGEGLNDALSFANATIGKKVRARKGRRR